MGDACFFASLPVLPSVMESKDQMPHSFLTRLYGSVHGTGEDLWGSFTKLRGLKLQGADHVLGLPSSAQNDKEFDAFPLECKSVVMNVPETWEEVLPVTPPLCISFLQFFSFLYIYVGCVCTCVLACTQACVA